MPGGPGVQQKADGGTATALSTGCEVRLHGLQSALRLNHQRGFLEQFLQDSKRWRVKLHSGETKDVKPENLERVAGNEMIVSANIGLETAGGVMTPVIHKGASAPVEKTITFTTFEDNQPGIFVQVFKGAGASTKSCQKLGAARLEGLPPRPRGELQISVTFRVDVSGTLHVTMACEGEGVKSKEFTVRGAASRPSAAAGKVLHSLGVKTAGGVMTPLISKGTPVPTENSMVFTTFEDNQTGMLVQVFKGEASKTADCELLSKVHLDGLQLKPRGEVQMRLSFKINHVGNLTLSLAEISEGGTASLSQEFKGLAECSPEHPYGSPHPYDDRDQQPCGLERSLSRRPSEKNDGQRRNETANRWGDGMDAPRKGARSFFPEGWVPQSGVEDALKVFGTEKDAIGALVRKAAELQQTLGKTIKLTPTHVTSVMSYTEENPMLYPVLNKAMRETGNEEALEELLTYIFFLDGSLKVLPSFIGRVFRGVNVTLHPSIYAANSIVTWQQFSSATKCPLVTLDFIGKSGRDLVGTLFIIESCSGKEIEFLSEFPEEQEVLFTYNSFFRVARVITDEEEKRREVPEFGGYGLGKLSMYILEQL